MNQDDYFQGLPEPQGLYDPRHEHDACGIGFVASIKGEKSHDIIVKGIHILINLTHRGASGCDAETGDGAGVSRRRGGSRLRSVGRWVRCGSSRR